jgi:hypothetical protein
MEMAETDGGGGAVALQPLDPAPDGDEDDVEDTSMAPSAVGEAPVGLQTESNILVAVRVRPATQAGCQPAAARGRPCWAGRSL